MNDAWHKRFPSIYVEQLKDRHILDLESRLREAEEEIASLRAENWALNETLTGRMNVVPRRDQR